MAAYYNEIDPFCVRLLRALMRRGIIADGDIDDRSIADVRADDVAGYDQCHFFAGIGGWSMALRMAGWDDDRPVWTGSCPCQPFSQAGLQRGFADARHLWPEFGRLIGERRPPIVLGEQVAGPAGRMWWDAVSAGLEHAGYAVGAADLCAAGVGAPHIRQRLYWCAITDAGGGGAHVRGWPTPASTDGRGGYRGGRMRNGKLSTDRLDVTAQLAGWSTPTANNGTGAGSQGRQGGLNLQTQAQLAGWPTPTPTATDATRGTGTIRPWDTGLPLPQIASLTGPARLTATGEMLTGSDAGTANGDLLNPELSCWLMGLPEEVLSCGLSATRLCRRSRRNLSRL